MRWPVLLRGSGAGGPSIAPCDQRQTGSDQYRGGGLGSRRRLALVAVPVNDFVASCTTPGKNRHTNRDVREDECTGEKFGCKRLGAGQVGWGEHGPDGQRRSRFERRYGLVENIFVRLFLGNFGLGRIRNLVATAGTRGNFAVGQ